MKVLTEENILQINGGWAVKVVKAVVKGAGYVGTYYASYKTAKKLAEN